MSEPNDSTPAPNPTPRQPVRMCVGCSAITTDPILIRSIEQGSGPGWSLYACQECAPSYLTADAAMQLLYDHTSACAQCALPSPTEPCPTGRILVRVHSRTLSRAAKSAP
jgi:hypothetical protein